jgi:hypothetical protein
VNLGSPPQPITDPPATARSTTGVSEAYFLMMFFIPVFAHAGHWAMWVLYLIPVLIVLAASARALMEQRREERDRGAEGNG